MARRKEDPAFLAPRWEGHFAVLAGGGLTGLMWSVGCRFTAPFAAPSINPRTTALATTLGYEFALWQFGEPVGQMRLAFLSLLMFIEAVLVDTRVLG